MKGVMTVGKKGKISPRYIGTFEVPESVGLVAYRLSLPPNLSGVHPAFHVSMLKRYHGKKIISLSGTQLCLIRTFNMKRNQLSFSIVVCVS